MAIVGHGGAGGYAPKNTLESFRKAIGLGCSRAELDVQLSEDGVPVVIHDGVLCGQPICELPLKLIKSCSNNAVPTLQDVIDMCRGRIGLQIELKAEGTPKAVDDALKRNGISDDVLVTSFEIGLLREMKAINPKLKLGLLFKEQPKGLWDFARAVPLDYICPRSSAVTEEMVVRAHGLGLKVYAYRVNDLETGERMLKMGVDDLGTDYPDLFQ